MEKKKIGILTFHRALNFGAMLQAFALQQTLAEVFNVEIVDYRCASIEGSYYPQGGICGLVKNSLKWALFHSRTKHSYLKRKNFMDFYRGYLKVSDKSYNKDSISKANADFDGFVSGSDQVWNPQLIGGDYTYMLDFAEQKKKFSYACSFGNAEVVLNNPERARIAKLLEEIEVPLLREEEGFAILEKLGVSSRNKAEQVCDPVFLLRAEQWYERLQLNPVKGRYILVYLVAPQTHALEFAKKLGEKLQMEVHYLNTGVRYDDCPDWCKNDMDVGPKGFLELILGAEYVVTTSFHGMALSIVNNKQFFYELSNEKHSRNSRLETLADVFGLHDREIISPEIPEGVEKINFDVVNKILVKYAGKSRDILMHSLEKIK